MRSRFLLMGLGSLLVPVMSVMTIKPSDGDEDDVRNTAAQAERE